MNEEIARIADIAEYLAAATGVECAVYELSETPPNVMQLLLDTDGKRGRETALRIMDGSDTIGVLYTKRYMSAQEALLADPGELVLEHIRELVPGGLDAIPGLDDETRLAIFDKLNELGLFNLKKTLALALNLLNIPQATAYRRIKD